MHFLQFSKEIFENFLKNFPNNCVFRPIREILTQGFLIFFEKSHKIIHFLIFLSNFLEIFKIFWRPGGGRPPQMFPPEPKSWRRGCLRYLSGWIKSAEMQKNMEKKK